MPQKYIIQKGVPIINPEYLAESKDLAPPPYSINNPSLAIVSTMNDLAAIAEVTKLATPQLFQNTLETMQCPAYIEGFAAGDLDGGALIDGLTNLFARYEVPIGLMSKLTDMKGDTLHFKIDDSGSMINPSNLLRSDASSHMQQIVTKAKQYVDPRLDPKLLTHSSRWEEAQDRLHILIDVLAYVPTGPIILSFLNRQERVVLDRTGKTPQAFLAESHQKIYDIFKYGPNGDTPIFNNLVNMLNEAKARSISGGRTRHYILSDGVPNGRGQEVAQIDDQLTNKRIYPELNPVTFLGCSDTRREYAWMHELEDIAPYIAALPDFKDERKEVHNDQGRTFPYSRGIWLLCNLVAATNPDDLDALDQHAPFTKATLENLMGRGIMEAEYKQYFINHPNAQRVFGPDYQLFLTSQFAHEIPSVQLFKSVLAERLQYNINRGYDNTENADELYAENQVINSRRRANAYAPIPMPNTCVSQYQGSLFNSIQPADNQPDVNYVPAPPNTCCIIL